MARVHIDDGTWQEFKNAAWPRPISEMLGELVRREVVRQRSRRLRESELEPCELVEAVELARAQQAELTRLIERLERVTRSDAG